MAGKSAHSFCDESWALRDSEAHEIVEGIYLGSVKAATNAKALDKWKISHVLVVDLTSSMLWPQKITYKRIKLEDTATANLLEVLPEALAFIGEAKLRRVNILVHCTRGVSRSASVVIAYLMLSKGLGYDAAKAHVAGKRSFIYPNLGFEVQLRHLQRLSKGVQGHWGQKMAWLRGAVPKGDLLASSNFSIQVAMGPIVRKHLEELRSLAEQASKGGVLLEQRAPWKSIGLFFENLCHYSAVPVEHGLSALAASVAHLLRQMRSTSSSELQQGINAAETLAENLETWAKLVAESLGPSLDQDLSREKQLADVLVLDGSEDDDDQSKCDPKRQRLQ